MRRILAAAALALASLLPTASPAATTWGTDMSDLWWNPNESGWGANVAHQGDTLFVTLFVYGTDNAVRWYVGPAMASMGGVNAFTFSGTIYETTGPYLGGIFNAPSVNARAVGIATLNFQSATRASFIYSVDGVNVFKTIERQTFRNNDMTGNYLGAAIRSSTGCSATPTTVEEFTAIAISQTGTNISITSANSAGLACTYAGAYAQSGRMGTITGSVSCSNGRTGTFQSVETEASYLGFLTRYSVDFGGGCTETGHIGGMKRG